MKLFIIEAYGGVQTTDGPIAHFTVNAMHAEDAIDIVRRSRQGQRFSHFEAAEATEEFEADEPGIIAEGEGSFLREP